MKHILTLPCGFCALMLGSCAGTPSGDASHRAPAEIVRPQAEEVFELESIAADDNHEVMGKFHFRHGRKAPISLEGFYLRDENGTSSGEGHVFRVRFESFEIEKDGKWTPIRIFSCGTGREQFSIKPDQDYTFLVPLWPLVRADGARGLVEVRGDGIVLHSKPFEVAKIQAMAKDKSAHQRKQ